MHPTHPFAGGLDGLPLFAPPAPPHNGTSTSIAAAADVADRAAGQRARLLAALIEAGPEGLTNDEAGELLELLPQSLTPRRGELVKAGLAIVTPRRRPTRTGSMAAVVVAARYADEEAGCPR